MASSMCTSSSCRQRRLERSSRPYSPHSPRIWSHSLPDKIDYPAHSRIREFHDCIQAVYEDIGKLEDQKPQLSVWYATPGVVHAEALAARQISAAARMDQTNLFSVVGFHAAGADELSELYDRSAKSATAEFVMNQHVKMPAMPGVEEAHSGILPAKSFVEEVLKDPLGHIRTAIFHDNVRDFLGYGVTNKDGTGKSVNAGIRQTLKHATARARFAVLNNGVTIVARRMTVVGHKFKLSDFQVVNGCQTCYVLFDRNKVADLGDDVYLTVRIIQSTDEDVISTIVEATNRQNLIAPDDLAVREKFHKELERFFPAQPPDRRLYYERRIGQHSQGKIEKTRVITPSQLTKAYAAMFLDEASRVSRLRQLQHDRAADLFMEGQDPMAYYASATAYYRLEWLIRNDRIESTYSPAKYHLIAGVRLLLLGASRIPKSVKAANKAFGAIAEAMWDARQAEGLFKRLISPIHGAINALDANALELPSLVRTERFGASLRSEILKLDLPT
jgi:AIPR protein